MSATDIEIIRRLPDLNESQKRLLLRFIGRFTGEEQSAREPITLDELVRRFSGAWGKELADEIEEVINRDCRRLPQDE